LFLAFHGGGGLESPALTLVRSLFYIRLISLTAGTLVYLFLLALILGHRRSRTFERLLFFLMLSVFLLYASGLLEMNAAIEYVSPPYATQLFYLILRHLGMAFLPALLVHVHFEYLRSIQVRRIPRWCWIVVWLLYALPFVYVSKMAFGLRGLHILNFSSVLYWLGLGGIAGVIPAVPLCAGVEFLARKSSKDPVERNFLGWLGALSVLISLMLVFPDRLANSPPLTADGNATALILLGVLPGALLLYYAVRRNFLEYGAQVFGAGAAG
jgi:hypothetical protein